MRITSEVMVTRSLDRLQTRLQAYERSQSQLATGRRILAPSDDPAGARRAMTLNAGLRARQQDLTNISDGLGWLNAADGQLQSATNRLQRVRELTVRGATSTDANERQALAEEIRQIGEELAGIANTQHRGRALFGGFSGGDAVTRETDGTITFDGTGDEITRRVSDTELVRVNVTAGEWLGDGPGDGNLLGLIDAIVLDLEGGDGAVISGRLNDIDVAAGRMNDSLSIVGAATNRVESARDRATGLSLTLRSELSEVQDVDVAEGIMELQVQQIAYEATLQALGKSLPTSLVAFLR